MIAGQFLELLSNVKSEHSGFGVSYYSEQCGRRARLKVLYEEPQEDKFAANTGTIFHKLMEWYYTGQLEGVLLPYSDAPDEKDPVQEALRLFAAYREHFKHDEWSTVGAEILLQGPKVEAAVGVSPFTSRLDLVVYLDEAQAAALSTTRRVDVAPGYYLVDHKTHSKKDSLAVAKHNMSLQFTAYHVAWGAENPDKPLQGTLVNEVIRHKKLNEREDSGELKSFRTYLIDKPGPTEIDALQGHLQRKQQFLKDDVPNLDACIGHSICRFYTQGLCSRV